MNKERTAKKVFSDWAGDDRAQKMWQAHLPRVAQVWPLISESNGNYLEIGCGCGLGLRHMAEHQYAGGQCLGIDVSQAMVQLAADNNADLPNASVECADFIKWQPADNRRFDLIFSMEVFYYFADIQQGLNRAYSLLVPGGRLWVLLDCYLENRESHRWSDALGVPMQVWSKAQYVDGFSNAGFNEISQMQINNPDQDAGIPTLCTCGVKER